MKKFFFLLMAFSLNAQARKVSLGLPKLKSEFSAYRHSKISTSSTQIELIDDQWGITGAENLADIIGAEKVKQVQGFRYVGPEVQKHCSYLVKESSIFLCSLQWVSVQLLDKDGGVVAEVPSGFVAVESSLSGIKAKLTIVTHQAEEPWKHFVMEGSNISFDFGRPMKSVSAKRK